MLRKKDGWLVGSEKVEPLKERPGTTNTCSTNRRLITQRELYGSLSGKKKSVYRERLGLYG